MMLLNYVACGNKILFFCSCGGDGRGPEVTNATPDIKLDRIAITQTVYFLQEYLEWKSQVY